VLGVALMESIRRARPVAFVDGASAAQDHRTDCLPGPSLRSEGGRASTPATGGVVTTASGGVSVPAVCGIRAIWVASSFRRQGTASKLVDAARSKCMMGYVVPRVEVAFSHPTEQGQQFAAHYTASREFLIY
jgi:N-acetyltransferase